MATARRINIVFSDNGSGLSRDSQVVAEALRLAGHRVWMTPLPPRKFPLALNYAPEIARQAVRGTKQFAVKALARRTRFWDINIFLERLVPEYFECAPVNCLFPHQEWLTDEDRGRLRDIDMVFFKTRHAMELLQSDAKASVLVGFTSPDRQERSVTPRWDVALHVCGWNPHKGTAAVVNAWAAHPEWPRLTMVSQLPISANGAANVEHLATRIPDARLRRLQNEYGIHVCPSEVEGFGHTLMEAMSCGAVLITTDAPPMDELVTPDEGFLVRHVGTSPMGAGIRYFVDEKQLTDVIGSVWRMQPRLLQRLRKAARDRYESTRASFHARLAQVIGGL
jgi:glycosyltransferase involved in cell wall biosynthesis